MPELHETGHYDTFSFNSLVHDSMFVQNGSVSVFHVNARSLKNKWLETRRVWFHWITDLIYSHLQKHGS